MKRYVLQPIMAFGLACSFLLSLHAQPCVTVNKISSFQYSAFIVGERNTITLRAEHNSIYIYSMYYHR
jgi:hypothetical protein